MELNERDAIIGAGEVASDHPRRIRLACPWRPLKDDLLLVLEQLLDAPKVVHVENHTACQLAQITSDRSIIWHSRRLVSFQIFETNYLAKRPYEVIDNLIAININRSDDESLMVFPLEASGTPPTAVSAARSGPQRARAHSRTTAPAPRPAGEQRHMLRR